MTGGGARVDGSDQFARREFDELAKFQTSMCVSLYLPTHRAGAEVEQDPIRFRNLLAAAERELTELEWRRGDIEELLDVANQLHGNGEWWSHQAAGLAVFIAPGVFRAFRAPIAFEELAVVSPRFHLRPLLPLITGDELFWVLALSQNAVSLFRGSRQAIMEVDTARRPPAWRRRSPTRTPSASSRCGRPLRRGPLPRASSLADSPCWSRRWQGVSGPFRAWARTSG